MLNFRGIHPTLEFPSQALDSSDVGMVCWKIMFENFQVLSAMLILSIFKLIWKHPALNRTLNQPELCDLIDDQ